MAKVIDPVCGMKIDSDRTATQVRYEGETYFFCSLACAREFNNNPARYAGVSSVEKNEPPFTTKGITVPKFGSAGSGGAEYERAPEINGREKTKH
jgi:YHS domain-containing protein